jgi:hypothetical protein
MHRRRRYVGSHAERERAGKTEAKSDQFVMGQEIQKCVSLRILNEGLVKYEVCLFLTNVYA